MRKEYKIVIVTRAGSSERAYYENLGGKINYSPTDELGILLSQHAERAAAKVKEGRLVTITSSIKIS